MMPEIASHIGAGIAKKLAGPAIFLAREAAKRPIITGGFMIITTVLALVWPMDEHSNANQVRPKF
jgi:hypothetical protein